MVTNVANSYRLQVTQKVADEWDQDGKRSWCQGVEILLLDDLAKTL